MTLFLIYTIKVTLVLFIKLIKIAMNKFFVPYANKIMLDHQMDNVMNARIPVLNVIMDTKISKIT